MISDKALYNLAPLDGDTPMAVQKRRDIRLIHRQEYASHSTVVLANLHDMCCTVSVMIPRTRAHGCS